MSVIRLCCALVLVPALAVAQATPAPARSSKKVQPPSTEEAPVAGTDTHTVQRGDTLWDLSARYLNSPWYWPKVWSYNPGIGNPHWIYPGNVIRLRAAGQQQPGLVAAPATSVEDDAEPAEREGEPDDVTVGGPYKIGYQPRGAYKIRRDTFVTSSEVDESGTITGAFEDKLLLTLHDRLYASFRDGAAIKPGATYTLFQTEGEVRHPVTGDLFGFRTRILGTARLLGVEKDVATLEVTRAFEPIERGARVGPWTEASGMPVRPKPNQRSVAGFIISAHQQILSTVGEHHVVFIDRGRTDGVEEGNLFTVVRSGDPYGRDLNEQIREGRDDQLPSEDVGLLMVVDAREKSSATLVVRSMRELYVGERVEMRGPPAGEAQPPAEPRRAAEPR